VQRSVELARSHLTSAGDSRGSERSAVGECDDAILNLSYTERIDEGFFAPPDLPAERAVLTQNDE
jgi:hypothetical protein